MEIPNMKYSLALILILIFSHQNASALVDMNSASYSNQSYLDSLTRFE